MKCPGLLLRRKTFGPAPDKKGVSKENFFRAAHDVAVKFYLARALRLIKLSVIKIGIQNFETSVREHRSDTDIMLFMREHPDIAVFLALSHERDDCAAGPEPSWPNRARRHSRRPSSFRFSDAPAYPKVSDTAYPGNRAG